MLGKIVLSKQYLLLSFFLFCSLFIAPNYANETSKGSGFDIKQYQGKVVYVDFWASWCGPCRKSFPTMNKFQKEYGKDNFAVVAVNVDKEKELADKFLAKYPANFEIVYDPEGIIASQFKVQAMPSTYIFNMNGEAKFAHKGFRQKDIAKLQKHIEALLLENEKLLEKQVLSPSKASLGDSK